MELLYIITICWINCDILNLQYILYCNFSKLQYLIYIGTFIYYHNILKIWRYFKLQYILYIVTLFSYNILFILELIYIVTICWKYCDILNYNIYNIVTFLSYNIAFILDLLYIVTICSKYCDILNYNIYYMVTFFKLQYRIYIGTFIYCHNLL